MAVMIKDNKVYILVADSDAIKDNKIVFSTNNKDKITTNYCPPENKADKDKFYEILGDLNRPVFCVTSKVKKYYKIMKSRIQNKYSSIFVGKMKDFEKNCSNFFQGDKQIADKLFLTGERPYLQFDGNDEWENFKKIIYGEVSSIVIEPAQDKFLCYPEFHPMFLKKEEYNNYDSSLDEEQDNQKYDNFKKLLKYFVSQLKINNDIIPGVKTSGKGADGNKIQLNYLNWRKYDNNITLDCAIQSGYQKSNSTTNYIHFRRYNIRPHFDSNHDVDYLYLSIYSNDNNIQNEINENYKPNKYSIDELGLFNNEMPNEKLKELFDNYFNMISKYEMSNESGQIKYENRKLKGENKIYYGTPGCGKSFKVKYEYCKKLKDGTNNYIRTIFHPDYTNVDFVGQLLPVKKEDNISYKFEAGPFTKALKLAYTHLDEEVYLIVEELNRGNSAAIFGELFQLLDRDENGDSEYGISNQYIKEELENELKDFSYNFDFNEIKIPSNLSIIATMNTSDQNVYPLDTAFQRRWKMEKIKNNFLKDGVVPSPDNLDNEDNYVSERAFQLSKLLIPGTETTWKDFVEKINKRINEEEFSSFGTEDKQIGIYFIGENELSAKDESTEAVYDKKKLFGEKVLKYVWDDLAKIDPDMWFKNEFNSLDKVLVGFEDNGLDIFNDNMGFDSSKKKDL